MAWHIADSPEDPHRSQSEALESIARRRGISLEELEERRRVAGIDSDSDDDERHNGFGVFDDEDGNEFVSGVKEAREKLDRDFKRRAKRLFRDR